MKWPDTVDSAWDRNVWVLSVMTVAKSPYLTFACYVVWRCLWGAAL